MFMLTPRHVQGSAILVNQMNTPEDDAMHLWVRCGKLMSFHIVFERFGNLLTAGYTKRHFS